MTGSIPGPDTKLRRVLLAFNPEEEAVTAEMIANRVHRSVAPDGEAGPVHSYLYQLMTRDFVEQVEERPRGLNTYRLTDGGIDAVESIRDDRPVSQPDTDGDDADDEAEPNVVEQLEELDAERESPYADSPFKQAGYTDAEIAYHALESFRNSLQSRVRYGLTRELEDELGDLKAKVREVGETMGYGQSSRHTVVLQFDLTDAGQAENVMIGATRFPSDPVTRERQFLVKLPANAVMRWQDIVRYLSGWIDEARERLEPWVEDAERIREPDEA